MDLIVVVVAGGLLFLVLTFLKTVIRRSPDQNDWVRRGGIYIPYVEFILWVIYYFWAIDTLFFGKSYYAVLLVSSVVIFLLAFAWFYFRNILAGVVFKMQYQPKRGRLYTFDSYSGILKEIKSAYLVLETSAGEELKVPYTHLFGPLYEASQVKSHEENTLKLRVAKSKDKEFWVQKIRNTILNSPWSSYKKDPVIKLISENEKNYEFEIVLNLLNPIYLAKIEKELNMELSGWE